MSRYENTKLSKSKRSRRMKYDTTLYQKVKETDNDIFVITTEGDRLDLLAHQFYGNPNLWWYIAHANHLNKMNLEAGLSLRIPSSTQFTKEM